jgi:hypothetical protein
VIYTTTRLAAPIAALVAWWWLADGTPSDPANLQLLLALGSAAIGIDSIRRCWIIRNTSRSRRDSSSFL